MTTDREPTAIEALRKRVVRAINQDETLDASWPEAVIAANAALKAIGLPLSSLAWAANNPETLAALASGEMVAVKAGTALLQAAPSRAVAYFCPVCGKLGGGSTGYQMDCQYRDRPHCLAVNPWPALPDPNPTDNPPMAMTEGR